MISISLFSFKTDNIIIVHNSIHISVFLCNLLFIFFNALLLLVKVRLKIIFFWRDFESFWKLMLIYINIVI